MAISDLPPGESSHASSGDSPADSSGDAAVIDDVIDSIVPGDLEWRRWVTGYPKTSLALAAFGGILLGRARGRAITAALTGFVADTATEGINEFLGRDVL